MSVLICGSSPRREITAGTREWADHNVNCIKGCSNNCRYCYAKVIGKRFGRCTEDTWKHMTIRWDVVNKRFGKYPGRVMFPSTHDITEASEVKEACYRVIAALLGAGNNLLLTTKPRLSVTTDITRLFAAYRSQLQFRFTITSIDNALLAFWEPGAPTYEERLESLQLAQDRAFPTSVSVEPFLDVDPLPLIESIVPFTTESVWIGPMNYIRRNGLDHAELLYYEDMRKRYEVRHLKSIYESLKGIPTIRFKDSLTNRLGLTIGNQADISKVEHNGSAEFSG